MELLRGHAKLGKLTGELCLVETAQVADKLSASLVDIGVACWTEGE
jgi:hypothetical protein